MELDVMQSVTNSLEIIQTTWKLMQSVWDKSWSLQASYCE
jgi:hypothetical protein